MIPSARSLFVVALSLSFLTPDSAQAQSRSASSSSAANGAKRVTLTRSVEPSFHIEPIVHRFKGRRGETIPFNFLIKSTGKAMDVTVIPVRLRQEESGIILHDTENSSLDAITFTSESNFKLDPGEEKQITGTVEVPLARSNFLSYGVLVRDNGMQTEPNSDNENRTNASVRFVTQYVLRIDIETGVKDLSEMDRLRFETAKIRNRQGMPIAHTYLVNPTDFAFECAVRGEIESANSSRPTPFRLGVPARANLQGNEKHLVRIMPHSRVRLEAPIEDLLFPGNQSFRLSVTNGRRALTEQSFDVDVRRGDFPALETQLAFLDDELSVQPSQIAVGQIAGVDRSCTLKFSNSSDNSKLVELRLQDTDGNTLDNLRLSSNKFEIRGGRSKTIRATLQRSKTIDKGIYGRILIAIKSEDGIDKQSLPLALLYGKPEPASIEVGELESVVLDGHTSFCLLVKNTGSAYVPVHGDLRVADSKGRIWDLTDGYGRWLEPGETRELRFMPEAKLEHGDYQLSIAVSTTADQEPITQTLVVELGADEAIEEPDDAKAEPASVTSNGSEETQTTS